MDLHRNENPVTEKALSYREILSGLRGLGIDEGTPCIAHASLSAFGQIRGGVETLLGALLAWTPGLMMPAFTYKTMLIPEAGPEHNAIQYGTGKDLNQMAEFFTPDMPADRLMGTLVESLRRHPHSKRSRHPILSFTGVGVEYALSKQTLADPFAPIRIMAEQGGWALLMGVDHSCNTSIHFGEFVAGRKGFIRWALTPEGVRECPQFSGCSEGFQAIAEDLGPITRKALIGKAQVQAVSLTALVSAVNRRIQADPLALLCNNPNCQRCQENRARVCNAGWGVSDK